MTVATIDDFKKIEIRIGEILTAEVVEGSIKLLKLSVNFNEEKPRQIISGIASYYPDVADLVGKKFAFATNLESRMIKGFESQGMILAAGGGDSAFSLLSASNDTVPGSIIK